MTLIIRLPEEIHPKKYYFNGDSSVTITLPDGSTMEYKLSAICAESVEFKAIQ